MTSPLDTLEQALVKLRGSDVFPKRWRDKFGPPPFDETERRAWILRGIRADGGGAGRTVPGNRRAGKSLDFARRRLKLHERQQQQLEQEARLRRLGGRR